MIVLSGFKEALHAGQRIAGRISGHSLKAYGFCAYHLNFYCSSFYKILRMKIYFAPHHFPAVCEMRPEILG